MIKVRLMGLDLRIIAIVKVSGVLELVALEDNDAAALVADCQVVARMVEGDG